jgi:hypothetical protein
MPRDRHSVAHGGLPYLINTVLVGVVNNKADDFMTSGNVVLRFKVLKYFRSAF